MTRLALALVFAAAFALSLLGTVPLGLALALSHAEEEGLSARAVSGSIWDGRVQDMSFRGIRMGDAAARLDPFALFGGTGRVRIQSGRGGAVFVAGRVQGVDRLNATVDFAELGVALPLDGAVRLDEVTLLFAGGRCSRAAGRISTDVFRHSGNGPELSGELGCDGDAAITHLEGRAGELQIGVTVRLASRGRYSAETRATGADPALRGALLLGGFAESGDSLVRIDEGRLGT